MLNLFQNYSNSSSLGGPRRVLQEDPINVRRLDREAPNWRNLHLAYRSQPFTLPQDIAAAILTALLIVAASILLQLLAATASSTIANAFAIIAFIVLFAVLGIGYYFFTRQRLASFAIMLCGPFLVPMLMLLNYLAQQKALVTLLLPFLMYLLYRFTDAVVHHFLLWLLHAPRVSLSTRSLWLDRFAKRLSPGELDDLTVTPPANPHDDAPTPSPPTLTEDDMPPALRSYRSTLRVFFLIATVAMLLPFRFFGPIFIPLSLPTLLIIGIAGVVMALSRVGVSDFRLACSLCSMALLNWLSYARHGIRAPGMFAGPAGSVSRRFWQTAGVYFFLLMFLPPLLHYFPIWMEVTAVVSDEAAADQWGKDGRMCLRPGSRTHHLFQQHRSFINRRAKQFFRKNYDRHVRNSSEDLMEFYGFTIARELPTGWSAIALDMVAHAGSGYHLYALAVGWVSSIVYPFFLFWLGLLVGGGPLFVFAYRRFESPEDSDGTHPTAWERHVAYMRASPDALEREHLWLGTHIEHDYPVLLHRQILSEHAYFAGDTGSGKSALGIAPMVTQLLRYRDAPVIVIDLKGDLALFHGIRAEAETAGLPFKHFTNELGRSTHLFNPFQQANVENISLNQVCETFLEALNLNHGEGYGRSYFSRVSRRWLSKTLRARPHLRSFDELYQVADQPEAFSTEKERQDAFELVAVIESLATFEQLNVTPASGHPQSVLDHAIHMPTVLQENHVVYFWLPAAVETASVREIAKLAIYALLTSAYYYVRERGTSKQCYLVIDEFQRVASDNFKIVLEQSRGMGIGAILANQTFADLRTHDTDLRPTIQTNTRFKQTFAATDLDQQETIMKGSGEAIRMRAGIVPGGESAQEEFTTRITRNHIIRITDDPFDSVVQISRGSGYSQYSGFSLPVRTSFHITEQEYERRRSIPWPEATDGTIVPRRKPLDPDEFGTLEARLRRAGAKPSEAPPPAGEEPPPSQWAERLKALHERLRGGDKPEEPA